MMPHALRAIASIALYCTLTGAMAQEARLPETPIQLRMIDSIRHPAAARWHSALDVAPPRHGYRFAPALPDTPPAGVSLLCALLAGSFIALRRLRRS